jgi:hypothetical protein
MNRRRGSGWRQESAASARGKITSERNVSRSAWLGCVSVWCVKGAKCTSKLNGFPEQPTARCSRRPGPLLRGPSLPPLPPPRVCCGHGARLGPRRATILSCAPRRRERTLARMGREVAILSLCTGSACRPRKPHPVCFPPGQLLPRRTAFRSPTCRTRLFALGRRACLSHGTSCSSAHQ